MPHLEPIRHTHTIKSKILCPVCDAYLTVHINRFSDVITAVSCFYCPWTHDFLPLQVALSAITLCRADATHIPSCLQRITDALYATHMQMTLSTSKDG